jgi:hypothetical protein
MARFAGRWRDSRGDGAIRGAMAHLAFLHCSFDLYFLLTNFLTAIRRWGTFRKNSKWALRVNSLTLGAFCSTTPILMICQLLAVRM